jgi:hypothetical protein
LERVFCVVDRDGEGFGGIDEDPGLEFDGD